jgi:2-desacetyl-2-hydroxyethyl bacteriochlorophyllide A dehydrogenase
VVALEFEPIRRRELRAVRVVETGVIEVSDVPEPSSSELYTVAVQQVGICGTDTKILAGKIAVEYPRTMGHEMVGEVVSAPGGAHHPVGARVLVDPGVACGWCDLCLSGRPHLCRNGGLMGRDVDGAFTEYVLVPENRLIRVPHTVSQKSAGLLQVLGTCVHAVKRVDPFPGQIAAVIGLGVAGQLLTQLLSARGVTVVGITRSEWKRQLAADSGAASVAGPAEAVPLLDELTQGRGPNLVVEAVGTEATLSQAIDLVGIGGEILAYGTVTGGGQGLPYYHLYHKELTLHNPRAAVVGDYADGVALAAGGALSLEPIVTHELELEDAGRAFELVHDSSSLKVLMKVA